MKCLLALAICAALFGCASTNDNSPYGDVTGSVEDQNGDTFRFGDAAEGDTIQSTGTNCAGTAPESRLQIALSSRAGFCAGSQGNIEVASNEVLLFSIFGSPASGGTTAPAIAPGTYPIGGGITDASGNSYEISATLAIFDALCAQEDLGATAGSIEIDSILGGEAIGSFTLDFGDTDNSLSGTFDTHTCPLTAAQLCSSGGNTTCSP